MTHSLPVSNSNGSPTERSGAPLPAKPDDYWVYSGGIFEMKRIFLPITAAAAIAAIMIVAVRAQNTPSERAALTAAAQALGGLERVRSIRNITLEGFGQYSYQFGGANITADPNAPQKYQAANDLKRVYDLEHGRFQQLERRNFLFPFAATFGHDWAQVNLVLDGDIAYNKTPD